MYHVHGTHVVPGMTPEQRRKAQRWEVPAMVVAVAVIPYLVLNFYAPGGGWMVVTDVAYIAIWAFFVVEALRMLALAPDNVAWARRNVLDVTIIVLTAPVTVWPESFDVLQVLWLLRILDLLPVVHRHLFRMTVVRFAFVLWGLTILGGGIAYATLERGAEEPPNLLQAIYWANTTVSTVGYGDFLPSTWQTTVLAMPLQAMGVVLGAILVAGILPLFDAEFARGFTQKVADQVERLAGDVADIEADIDAIGDGERAQDRVMAQMARDLAFLRRQAEEREPAGTDG